MNSENVDLRSLFGRLGLQGVSGVTGHSSFAVGKTAQIKRSATNVGFFVGKLNKTG